MLIDVRDPRWMAFIQTHQDATIFHHPSWIQVLTDCYGYRPHLLAVLDSMGQLMAGLPLLEVRGLLSGRRVVALPFSDFCQPLAVDDASHEKLITALLASRSDDHWERIEVRWQLPDRHGIFTNGATARHVTALTQDASQVYTRFRSSVPRLIRQAEKAGVEIRRSNSWDDVRTFYCLHMQTRRRLGVPVQPLRFFRCLWQHVLSQRLGFTLLAFKDQTPIAGGVFLHWHKMLTYKYGASLSEYWQLRPNNLLFWNAIRWGCEQGYQSFDWGRTDLDDEGLRNFKRGWGSEEHIVNYHVVANSSPASQSTRSRVRFVEPLIQHSPVWVGRAIGTLLYGHFG